MRPRLTFAALIVAALALGAEPVRAAEVRVLTTGAFKQVVLATVPRYEAGGGDRVVVENDTAGGVLRRVREGQAFDLLVLTPAGVDDLIREGKVAGTRTDLAKVGIGVAVKAGAPRPDISSAEGFKAALLGAKSVALIDPKAGGSSGVYLAGLFQRMGIADAIAAKSVLVQGGYVAERVAKGEAEIAVHQVSEILPVPGVDLVGTLPAEVQNYTVYAAGIGAAAREPEAARRFLALLTGPEGADLLHQKGMLLPTETPR